MMLTVINTLHLCPATSHHSQVRAGLFRLINKEEALVGAFSGHCENLLQAPDYGSWGVDEDDDADRPDEGSMV